MHLNIGLSLTGGGARGAYQAGVAAGLSELLIEFGYQQRLPIQSLSGVSAGAINAAYLAAGKGNFSQTSTDLSNLWSSLTPDQVYRTDIVSIGKIGLGWVRDFTFGAAFKTKVADDLLDATPLNVLIRKNINFDGIQQNIDSGELIGVACTAYSYGTRKTVNFLQCQPHIEPWVRSRRHSKFVHLNHYHVFASCAIPIIFSPVNIDGQFFGDGSLRNTAPVSPIVHLGADKIVMVDVRYKGEATSNRPLNRKPSVSEVIGIILNGLFFDTTDVDMERLARMNLMAQTHTEKNEPFQFKNISFVKINPSVDLATIAESLSAQHLPPAVDYLLRGLGDRKDYAELASYLLFDSSFTKKLIELGYEDVRDKKIEIEKMLTKE